MFAIWWQKMFRHQEHRLAERMVRVSPEEVLIQAFAFPASSPQDVAWDPDPLKDILPGTRTWGRARLWGSGFLCTDGFWARAAGS